MKALIFDFDGTLADSFGTMLTIYQELTKHEALNAAQIADLRGQKLNQIVKRLKIKKWQIPKLMMRGKKQLAIRMAEVQLFPGVKKALAEVSRDNKIYILSTNSPANIEIFLRRNRIDRYITRVYGNIGLFGKSAALKKLIKTENLTVQDCVYIGDEIRDIEAARKAKVTAVGVTWGFNNPQAIRNARPDFVVDKVRKLEKLVKAT